MARINLQNLIDEVLDMAKERHALNIERGKNIEYYADLESKRKKSELENQAYLNRLAQREKDEAALELQRVSDIGSLARQRLSSELSARSAENVENIRGRYGLQAEETRGRSAENVAKIKAESDLGATSIAAGRGEKTPEDRLWEAYTAGLATFTPQTPEELKAAHESIYGKKLKAPPELPQVDFGNNRTIEPTSTPSPARTNTPISTPSPARTEVNRTIPMSKEEELLKKKQKNQSAQDEIKAWQEARKRREQIYLGF